MNQKWPIFWSDQQVPRSDARTARTRCGRCGSQRWQKCPNRNPATCFNQVWPCGQFLFPVIPPVIVVMAPSSDPFGKWRRKGPGGFHRAVTVLRYVVNCTVNVLTGCIWPPVWCPLCLVARVDSKKNYMLKPISIFQHVLCLKKSYLSTWPWRIIIVHF